MKALRYLLILVVINTLNSDVFAQVDNTDLNFGVNGIANMGFTPNQNDWNNAIAIQSDDKIIMAGYTQGQYNADFCFGRFTKDGAADSTFGTEGKVVINLGSIYFTGDESVWALALKNQSIFFAGQVFSPIPSKMYCTLGKLKNNGEVDATFGDAGFSKLYVGSQDARFMALKIQSDDKIVCAGYGYVTSIAKTAGIVARFMPDGSLDTLFGEGGKVVLTNATMALRILSMVVQADGKIVVGGVRVNESTNLEKTILFRLNSNGSTDSTFANNGVMDLDLTPNSNSCHTLLIQQDGKLVTTGDRWNPDVARFALFAARFTTSGALDESFGAAGTCSYYVGERSTYGYCAQLQPDDRILLGGTTQINNYSHFAVTRMTKNGVIDGTFADSGRVSVQLSPYNDWCYTLGLQSDGRIILGGLTSGTNWDFAAIRVYNRQYLPVELTSFTANTTDGKVQLNWETATELQNYGFDVERCAKGSDNWVKIGFVAGKGSSSAKSLYTFTDVTPLTGENSYRLKQIDINGTSKVIASVAFDLTIPNTLTLEQNYPNPFNPSTTIRFSLPMSEKVTLNVYDMLGNKVAELVNETMTAGNHLVTFTGSNLASGVYVYRLNAGNITLTKKLMLMK